MKKGRRRRGTGRTNEKPPANCRRFLWEPYFGLFPVYLCLNRYFGGAFGRQIGDDFELAAQLAGLRRRNLETQHVDRPGVAAGRGRRQNVVHALNLLDLERLTAADENFRLSWAADS